jgi:hypothetical protein
MIHTARDAPPLFGGSLIQRACVERLDPDVAKVDLVTMAEQDSATATGTTTGKRTISAGRTCFAIMDVAGG